MFKEDYVLSVDNKEVIQKIKDYLYNRDDIAIAYLFGSFDTDDFNSSSDIDIAILPMKEISYSECLRMNSELEEFYKEIISKKYENNALVKRSMELSFRSLFNSFQSLVEDYISIVLRTLSIDVSKMYFRQCLDLCVENKFLSQKFVDVFKPAIKLRNDIAHGYDVPTIEALIEYYENNKEVYKEYIDNIRSFKDSLKENDIF